MPPGDCFNDRRDSSGQPEADSERKLEDQDWESSVIREAAVYKEYSVALKNAGCPLFGGGDDEKLPVEIRAMAKKLDHRLDEIIGFSGSTTASFRSRTRDELRLFVCQGDTLSAFKDKMKQYDFSLKCNVVWSSDAIAYRCNTCAFNPCMSLCADCFHRADHSGHDYRRFFSHAGGACDCGSPDVLRESGFCSRHGENAKRPPPPPDTIISLAEFIIPKLFIRLFLYFRGWQSKYQALVKQRSNSSETSKEAFSTHLVMQSHLLIEFIQELVEYGGPLRSAVARILLDQNLYHDLSRRSSADDLDDPSRPADFSLDWRTQKLLEEDLVSLESVFDADKSTFELHCLLDELVFWMVRLIFPQSLINLCLSMLSETDYKNSFARRFFLLYPCVAAVMVDMAKSEKNPTIFAVSSRIIHISVQILSSEAMCVKLDDEIGLTSLIIRSTLGLLRIGVQQSYITQSPKYFFANTPPLLNAEDFTWQVFSVGANQPLRKHSYWTLVSDMQNLLGHSSIVRRLFRKPETFDVFVQMIGFMQGMNVNFRIVSGDHVEYDTAQPYQLSFHLEWEVASLNMFNTVGALTDEIDCMEMFFRKFRLHLEKWFHSIQMSDNCLTTPPFFVTYHIPMHRYLSAAIYRCVESEPLHSLLKEIIADDEPFLRKIALHPVRIQVCRAETSAGMWARNGNAARNQSSYYAQTSYSTAFIDCDISLLRFIAANVNPEWFLNCIIISFYFHDCFAFNYSHGSEDTLRTIVTRAEWVDPLIDGILRLLLELVAIPYIGDKDIAKDIEREMVAALAVEDLTYSKLLSAIPEKGARSCNIEKYFDSLLSEVAEYNEPDQGRFIQQGVYKLTAQSWKEKFDPVFCRVRSMTAKEYNDALLRAEHLNKEYLLRTAPLNVLPNNHLWTPYRLLEFKANEVPPFLQNLGRLLIAPTFFAITNKILELYVDRQRLSVDILQQTVYLLTLSVKFILSEQFAGASSGPYCSGPYCADIDADTGESLLTSMYQVDNPPAGEEAREFYLNMFTKDDVNATSPAKSILSYLLRYLRQTLSEGGTSDPDRTLCSILTSQLAKDCGSLSSILGYDIDYIGRLVNLLYNNSKNARSVIDAIIKCNSQNSEEPEKTKCHENDDADAALKAERRLAAKRRQAAVMAAYQKKTASLMRKLMIREGLTQMQMDAMDTSEKSAVKNYECPICNDTTASTLSDPVGLLVRIVINNAVEHSLPANGQSLNLIEVNKKALEEYGCVPEPSMLKHWYVQRKIQLDTRFPVNADLIQMPTGVEVRSCGHYAHLRCYKAYEQTLQDTAGSLRVNPGEVHVDVSCPTCRAVVHSILPLVPDIYSEKIRLTDSPDLSQRIMRNIEAINKSIQNVIGSQAGESDEKGFFEYRQSFIAFSTACEKHSSNRGDLIERLRAKGQTFVLGLARGNCERNILFSKLELPHQNSRTLPTEHIIFGGCCEATPRDRTFALYQWRCLSRGFLGSTISDEPESESDRELRESELDLPDENAVRPCPDDANILASTTVKQRLKSILVRRDIEIDSGTPVLLFDMNSVLIRLSAYVITENKLLIEDKRELLSFIYRIILSATIVRTSFMVALRISKIQAKELLQSAVTPLPSSVCPFSQAFKVISHLVVRELFTRKHVSMDEMLSSNHEEKTSFVEPLLYACTELARLTAELWHECHISETPSGMSISSASFLDLHRYLTGNEDFDFAYLPTESLRSFVRVVSRWIPYRHFSRVLSTEPLIWQPFCFLSLPESYDDLFQHYFGQVCVNCATVPRTPLICLLCSSLVCLDSCCVNSGGYLPDNEVERHAVQCGSGCGCFISLNTSLVVFVSQQRAALWGSVYLDAHGEEDRNLKRGKPLFLSSRRVSRLRSDWTLQVFEHLSLNFFHFEHLSAFLRDAHYVLSN